MLPLPSNAYFTEESPDSDGGDRETLPPPTIPSPMQSEVRIKVRKQRPVVDLVTADLELDPRSEDYLGDTVPGPTPLPLLGLLPPPAHSLPACARSGPLPVGMSMLASPPPRFDRLAQSAIAPRKKAKRLVRRRAG